MSKLAIIDADSMIYIVAWKFRTKKVANMVRINLNQFIQELLKEAGATHYVGFFGSTDKTQPNFRFALDPEYKANRPETPDFIVKWRPTIHKEMEEKWKFMPIIGMESDDAVAIAEAKYRGQFDEIVVITADKDLKQIANTTHFDMNKHKFTKMDQLSSDKFFAEQMLKGDTGDNIKGLPGIGPKKALALVDGCKTSADLKWMLVRMYKNHFEGVETKITKSVNDEIELEWAAWLTDLKLDDKHAVHKMSDKQIERQKRLFVSGAVKKRVTDETKGGWRTYIKQQYELLRMIDVAPDGFIVPDVIEFASSVVDEAEEADVDFLGL